MYSSVKVPVPERSNTQGKLVILILSLNSSPPTLTNSANRPFWSLQYLQTTQCAGWAPYGRLPHSPHQFPQHTGIPPPGAHHFLQTPNVVLRIKQLLVSSILTNLLRANKLSACCSSSHGILFPQVQQTSGFQQVAESPSCSPTPATHQ